MTAAGGAGPGTVILIRDFQVPVLVGVHAHERVAPQVLRLDIEIELPGRAACRSDRLADTIDYAEVVEDIRHRLAGTRFLLLERLADDLGRFIVERFGARRASVQALKPGILPGVGAVGVRIETRAPTVAVAAAQPPESRKAITSRISCSSSTLFGP